MTKDIKLDKLTWIGSEALSNISTCHLRRSHQCGGDSGRIHAVGLLDLCVKTKSCVYVLEITSGFHVMAVLYPPANKVMVYDARE